MYGCRCVSVIRTQACRILYGSIHMQTHKQTHTCMHKHTHAHMKSFLWCWHVPLMTLSSYYYMYTLVENITQAQLLTPHKRRQTQTSKEHRELKRHF